MSDDPGASASDDLLQELRRLVEAFPLPHPSWHPYVPEMRAVVGDLGSAIDAIASLPAARAALLRQVEGTAGYPEDDRGGPSVREARRRLRDLPLPEGQHPFLAAIRATIEAAEAALAALASVADEPPRS